MADIFKILLIMKKNLQNQFINDEFIRENT